MVENDFLHYGQPHSLGDPTFELADELDGIEDPSDVLRGGDLDDPDEPEIDVNVDDGPMGGKANDTKASPCPSASSSAVGRGGTRPFLRGPLLRKPRR